jgi:hypothetical protein
MPIVDAAVIHRDGEKTRRAERFVAGTELLEMPAKGFAGLVDACDHLEERPRGGGRQRKARLRGQGVEHLDAMSPLVGQVKEPPPLGLVESGDGVLEPQEFVFIEVADVMAP